MVASGLLMAQEITSDDLKGALEAEIRKTKKANNMEERGGFVPNEFLDILLTPRNIKKRLQTDFPRLEEMRLEQWTRTIHKSGMKLYAILILLDESRRIKDLFTRPKPPVVDDVLLFQEDFCTEKDLQKIGLWDIKESFYRAQWIFPPLLTGKSLQKFDPTSFIFPFTSKRKKVGHGSFGVVFKVEIAKGHMKLPPEYVSVR